MGWCSFHLDEPAKDWFTRSWKSNDSFIFCTGYGQHIRTFLGIALVVGTDEEGNTVSHKQDIEKFKRFINFFE